MEEDQNSSYESNPTDTSSFGMSFNNVRVKLEPLDPEFNDEGLLSMNEDEEPGEQYTNFSEEIKKELHEV